MRAADLKRRSNKKHLLHLWGRKEVLELRRRLLATYITERDRSWTIAVGLTDTGRGLVVGLGSQRLAGSLAPVALRAICSVMAILTVAR